MKARLGLRKFVAGVSRRFSYEVACNGAERIVDKKVRGNVKCSSMSVLLSFLEIGQTLFCLQFVTVFSAPGFSFLEFVRGEEKRLESQVAKARRHLAQSDHLPIRTRCTFQTVTDNHVRSHCVRVASFNVQEYVAYCRRIISNLTTLDSVRAMTPLL